MEPPKVKSPQSVVSSGSKLLRYPLRSASKTKNEKPVELATDSRIPPVSKREKHVSSVSKSVNLLDLSGKERAPKPPRRLSILSKSPASPVIRSAAGSITPIPERRGRRMANATDKGDTPASDASRSINRRKFSVLSSASYWLSQIKLSESASKHLISLGFFKLAQESECEPFQKLRDELKAYAHRHRILELGGCAKEVLRSYTILEEVEQSQMSEDSCLVQEDEDSASEVTVGIHGNVKSVSVTSEKSSSSFTHGTEAKKNGGHRRNNTSSVRTSMNRSSVNLGLISLNNSINAKSTGKGDPPKEKGNIKISLKKESEKDSGDISGSPEEHANKENVAMENHGLEAQSVA